MPETPEIVRKRKRNMERNANFRTNLDAGFGGSLLPTGEGAESTLAAASAVATAARVGACTGGGGSSSSSNRSGVSQPLRNLEEEETGGGEGEGLVPLDSLMRRWPGRGEQIVELAQLIGEVSVWGEGAGRGGGGGEKEREGGRQGGRRGEMKGTWGR